MENNAAPAGGGASLVKAVFASVNGRLREGVPASGVTTLSVGGPIQYLVTVESVAELQAVMRLLSSEEQRMYVLGHGSNLLVADAGLAGWVLRLGSAFKGVECSAQGEWLVGGAAPLMALARQVSDQGFSGLEFAAGIPASLGGSVFMNAGAHRGEIADRLVSVTGVLPDGELVTWRRDELPWKYRSSGLPAGVVVTAAKFQLVEGDRAEISRRCTENLTYRRSTQPLTVPSAGSVFKNPSPEMSAGRVLEDAGLKGVSIGGAMVSPVHANWIVNPEKKASASDVARLIEMCQHQARDRLGVFLEPEVRMWK